MKKKLQTSILINLYTPRSPKVEIERRRVGIPKPDQVGEWYSKREYSPTPASKRRLEQTINHWIEKQWANISLCLPLIEIELTA